MPISGEQRFPYDKFLHSKENKYGHRVSVRGYPISVKKVGEYGTRDLKKIIAAIDIIHVTLGKESRIEPIYCYTSELGNE